MKHTYVVTICAIDLTERDVAANADVALPVRSPARVDLDEHLRHGEVVRRYLGIHAVQRWVR